MNAGRRSRPCCGLFIEALTLALASSCACPERGRDAPLVRFDEQGVGPAVVFIHGGQMDRRMWDPQIAAFSGRFRCIRHDVRGYGETPMASRFYSDREDLKALLDRLGIDRAALVGLSLGGRIAIDFALSHPDRVAALVLAGPGLGGFQFDEGSYKDMGAILEAASDGDFNRASDLWLATPYMAPAMEQPGLRDRLRQLTRENGYCWVQSPLLNRSLKPPAVERLAEIRAPTLVLVGDRDVPDIQKICAQIEKEVPGARKVVLNGAGHILSLEKPEEFNRLAMEFLEAIRTDTK